MKSLRWCFTAAKASSRDGKSVTDLGGRGGGLAVELTEAMVAELPKKESPAMPAGGMGGMGGMDY